MKVFLNFIFLLLNSSLALLENFSGMNDFLKDIIHREFQSKAVRVYLTDDHFCFTGKKVKNRNLTIERFECLDYSATFSPVISFEVIRNSSDLENRLQYENALVVLTTNQNSDVLTKIVQNLKMNSFWNTKLIAVLFSPLIVDEPSDESQSVLLRLWKEARIWNAVVVTIGSLSGPFYFYRRYPYEKKFCKDETTATVDSTSLVVGKWESGRFIFDLDPFPFRKMAAEGLNGCTVTASTTQTNPYVLRRKNPLDFRKGFDVRILNAVAEKYDFKVRYAFPPEGETHWTKRDDESGNYIGTMGLLHRNEADVGFSGLRLESDFYRDFGISKPYFIDSIVWCVPRPAKIKAWKKILVVFSKALWLSVGIAFAVTVCVFRFFSKVNPDKRSSLSSPVVCFADVLRLSLGSCVPRPPITTSSRCLFLTFVLYSLNITTCYTSSLVSILTRVSYEEPIESAREAFTKGLSIAVFPPEKRFFQEEFSEKELKDSPGKFREVRKLHDILDEIAFNGTAVFAVGKIRAKYIVNQRYLDDEGVPLIRFFTKSAASELLVFYFSPNHPLKHLFDDVIIRMQESGILDLWLRDFFQRADARETEKPRQRPLTFIHLEGAFMLLAALLFFSCIVFLYELVLFRFLHNPLLFRNIINFNN